MMSSILRRATCAGLAIVISGIIGLGAAMAQSLTNYMRTERQKEERTERDAERKAKLPHPVSTAHQGTLTPVYNLAALLPNKTLYLQTPIVQNGQLQRVEVAPIYFAPTGQAYSSQWAGKPWQANGNSVCMSTGQKSDCMTAFSDSTGQAFLLGSTQLLVQVGRIAPGDSDNVKEAYQQAQAAKAEAEKKMISFLGPLLLAAMSSGGGGGGKTTTYYQYGSGGGSSGSGGGYTAPVGGETGLYGSCHGVGC